MEMTAQEFIENVLGSSMGEMAEAQERHEMEEQERIRKENSRFLDEHFVFVNVQMPGRTEVES